jgi:3-isopropylmalate/(R)-2-methylmalate dehydratase large subunit
MNHCKPTAGPVRRPGPTCVHQPICETHGMSGKTISEKILSIKSGCEARAGDFVVCSVDYAMGTDGSTPMAIDYFEQMGGSRVLNPERIVFVMDHYPGDKGMRASDLQDKMRAFAAKYGIAVHEIGEGICHQLMIETGRTRPGGLLVGADSHSVTGGALNAFATGIGSSDLAATMICGRIWLKVPQTIKVVLTGRLRANVYPKDLALELARRLGVDGASYQAIEFHGPGASGLDLEDRIVISNMSVEMGAKAGIFTADSKTIDYLRNRTSEAIRPVEADADARYIREIALDLSELEPNLARPHAVENVVSLRKATGIPIRMVYLGTCTGGRVRDFHQALRILVAAGGIAAGVQLVATPASREVEAALRSDGTLQQLEAMGAVVTPPGCGSCCGTAGPIPGDGVNVMSTANRNFRARMGNATAAIYLASPASCAAAAATGRIADPSDFAEGAG